jgi:hypothetical protein
MLSSRRAKCQTLPQNPQKKTTKAKSRKSHLSEDRAKTKRKRWKSWTRKRKRREKNERKREKKSVKNAGRKTENEEGEIDQEQGREAEIVAEDGDLVQDQEVDLEATIDIAEEVAATIVIAAGVIDPEVDREAVIAQEAEIALEVAIDGVEGDQDPVLPLVSDLVNDLSKRVESEQKLALHRTLQFLLRHLERQLLQHQNKSTARLLPVHLQIPLRQTATRGFDVLVKHPVGLVSGQSHQRCSKGHRNQFKQWAKRRG